MTNDFLAGLAEIELNECEVLERLNVKMAKRQAFIIKWYAASDYIPACLRFSLENANKPKESEKSEVRACC
jgi:hypothetical protein